MLRDVAFVRSYSRGMVRESLAKLEKQKLGSEDLQEQDECRGAFIRAMADAGLSEEVIADACVNFFMAGERFLSPSFPLFWQGALRRRGIGRQV